MTEKARRKKVNSCEPPLQELIDLVREAINPVVIEDGKRRQAAVWCGEETDYLPLLLGHTEYHFKDFKEDRSWKMAEHKLRGGVVCREMWDFPHYTFSEQQDDPLKMLYEMLWEILSWARSRSDAVLSVRPYYLRSIESALGVELVRSEETHVYVSRHLTREEAYGLEPGNLFERGLFPKIAECIDLMKEHLPEGVHIFPNDTGGPLVLAESILGDALWYDFYDRPDDVCAFIRKCGDLCKEVARWYKQKLGDPLDQTYHGPLFQARGGVRVVNDSIVNLSPAMHREFVFDAINDVFEEFSGGWFHSCGVFQAHLDDLLAVPALTAINFGNPEHWPDFETVVRRIIDAGKIYYGSWPRKPGESMKDYLRRAVRTAGPDRRGMNIFLQGEGPFPKPEETMALWHRLQDEYRA